jgi:hypothetical protein
MRIVGFGGMEARDWISWSKEVGYVDNGGVYEVSVVRSVESVKLGGE